MKLKFLNLYEFYGKYFDNKYVKYSYLFFLITILSLIFYFFYNSRPIVTGDEFINIVNRTSSISDTLDYSLRPLYRLINISWVNFLGKELESLLIGSAVTFTIINLIYAFFVWKMSKNYLILTLSLLILYISPEILRIGLGALPLIYSGFFLMMFGIFFYFKIENINSNNNKSLKFGVLSYLFLFFALVTHHTMLFLLVCVFVLELIFIILIINSLEFKTFLKKNLKIILFCLIFLLCLILLTNFVYIIFQESLAINKKVSWFPNDEKWTYLNLWYHVLFGSKLSSETRYVRPFLYYNYYLFKNETLFYLLWMLSIVSMIGNLFFRKIKINEIKKYIPLIISIIYLLILSIFPKKLYYVLASFAPIASLSIAIFLKDIFSLLINRNIFLVLIFFLFLNLLQEYSLLEKQFRHPVSDEYKFIKSANYQNMFVIDKQKFNIKDKRGGRYCRDIAVGLNIKKTNVYKNFKTFPPESIFCNGKHSINHEKVAAFIQDNNLCRIKLNNLPFKNIEVYIYKNCIN